MQDTNIAIALHTSPPASTVADDILRIAHENDIPLRQDPALAASLATLDIGSHIPPELFRAVAEVLAFVHKLNAKA